MTKVEVFVSSTCPHCPAAIQVVEEAKLQVSDLEVEICNVEEKVRYWLKVSEYDYNEYKIGDYYKL